MLHGQNQNIIFLVGFVFENPTNYMRNFEQLLNPDRVVKHIFIEKVRLADKPSSWKIPPTVGHNKNGVVFKNTPVGKNRSNLDEGYWFAHDAAIAFSKLGTYNGFSLGGRTSYVKEKLLEQKLTYQYKEVAELLNELKTIGGNDDIIQSIITQFNRDYPDYKLEWVDWEDNQKPHYEIIDM